MAKAKTRSKRTSTGSRTGSNSRTQAKTGSKSRSKASVDKSGSLLGEYFYEALKDIYWAEKALTKALPKMSKNATGSELKKAFDNHLQETKKQIERLEQVFEKFGKKAQAKKCEAMQGLIEESEEIISETKDDTATRDAALIISAQKVEHYEIATYGGLAQLARTMKRNDLVKLLETTLNEEKKADELLTKVAEKGGVNQEASDEPGEKGSLKENIMSIFS
jgi:ferritin-like metal-binding protein YciE